MAEAMRQTLSNIPPELQAQILLNLDGAAIKACEKVCKSLFDVVKTPVVQYKLELETAGMIDGPSLGPSGDHPTTERLEKLRAYQKAWTESSMSLFPSTSFGDSDLIQTWESYNGGFAFAPNEGEYYWFRPGSALRGYKRDRRNLKDGQIPDFSESFRSVAVDIEQDLLIATRRSGVLVGADELHFLSFRAPGPHSRAAQPIVYARTGFMSLTAEEGLQVCRDLVAWKIRQDVFKLQVWNWQTGELLWQCESPDIQGRSHALLDHAHLLIFLPQRNEFRVYSINSRAEQGGDPAGESDLDNYVCAFELPPKLPGVSRYGVRQCIGGAIVQINLPPDRKHQHVPFLHNPANAIVAIYYRQSSPQSAYEYFLLLVPLGTILPTVHAMSQKGALSEPERIVLWAEWGPRGSRLLRITGRSMWISTFGSKCAIVYNDDSSVAAPRRPLDLRAFILDVHPSAALSPSHADASAGESGFALQQAADCICLANNIGEMSTTTPSDVCTTLPCRLLYREFLVNGPAYAGEFYLTEDGMAVYGWFRQDGNFCGGIYGFSI